LGKPPLVSCIVAAHNSAPWIEAAIRSILDQTYRPIEVIVVDDGSEDDTAARARALGDPVRVVTQPAAGPSATRNRGLHESRGEFVAWLDADDLWHPEKLERQMAHFRDWPDLDCSVTHAQNFWEEGLDEEAARYGDHPRMQPIPGYAMITVLARRSLFDEVGELDTSRWFGDAVDWFIRARERGATIELLPDVLTFHRLRRDGLSLGRSHDSEDEFLDIVKASLDRRRRGEAGS
jgi:glycosyltransferase involved in cell wall biosynthesis